MGVPTGAVHSTRNPDLSIELIDLLTKAGGEEIRAVGFRCDVHIFTLREWIGG